VPPDGFKTQILLLHSDQGTLDKLGSEFDNRYTVHFATSGSQALSALAEVPIDVFVSAHDLPGMSGLEALREAKTRSPRTLGILLTDAASDEGAALVGDEEIFQVVRGQVTGAALLELVENASQQIQLPLLSKSANDTTADAESIPEHIVMETAGDGSSIISQSSVRLRALNPKSYIAATSVELLVLTTDAEFLETIRASTNNMHKVLSAATLQEANDVIRNHKIGIAVVDAAVVRDKIEQLTEYLRQDAPRLVSIVAGRRDDGEMLMGLVNRGKVYRFLLKPVSTGRARLAVAASVKHHLEAPDAAFISSNDTTEPPPSAMESSSPVADVPQEAEGETAIAAPVHDEVVGEPGGDRHASDAPEDSTPTESLSKTGAYRMAKLAAAESRSAGSTHRFGKLPIIGGAAAVLAAVSIGFFFLSGESDNKAEPPTAMEPVTTAPAVTEADIEFIPPAVEPLLNIAEKALLDARLQDADDALQRVTALEPGNARLPFLTAQLAQAQLRLSVNEVRAAIREGRFEDAADALSAAQSLGMVSDDPEFEMLTAELKSARSEQQTDEVLALAKASLESGALLSPPNGNARYYYELVLSNDAENAAAQQGLSIVASRIVLLARAEIDNGNFDNAEALLYEARALDSKNSDLVSTANALRAARESAEADRVAAERAAAERAMAERVAAERAAAESAAIERLAAERAAVVRVATESAAEEPAVDAVPGSNMTDTTAPASVPAADKTRPLDVAPAAINSLVRTKYVAPKYPRNALRRNLSGWVDVEFTVSTDGTVKDVGARASEPGDVFVDSATRAVEQWEFEPVSVDGAVVEKRAAVRMAFALD
jgi:TonB family protein